jgi:hypothetical protein
MEFFDFFEKVSFFTVFVLRMSREKRENSQEKFENLSIMADLHALGYPKTVILSKCENLRNYCG